MLLRLRPPPPVAPGDAEDGEGAAASDAAGEAAQVPPEVRPGVPGQLPLPRRPAVPPRLDPADGLRDGRKAIAQDDGEEWNRPQKGFVLYGICTVL